MITPTDTDRGREILHIPGLFNDDGLIRLHDSAAVSEGIYVGAGADEKTALVRLRDSHGQLGEIESRPLIELIWYFQLAYPRNDRFWRRSFAADVARHFGLISLNSLRDAAIRLEGKIDDPDTGEPYTVDQIHLALWVWLQDLTNRLESEADEYATSGRALLNASTFEEALAAIARSEDPEARKEEASAGV